MIQIFRLSPPHSVSLMPALQTAGTAPVRARDIEASVEVILHRVLLVAALALGTAFFILGALLAAPVWLARQVGLLLTGGSSRG